MSQNKQEQTKPFVVTLAAILTYAEIVSIILGLLGATLRYRGMLVGDKFLTLGLMTLACVYFLKAFVDQPPRPDAGKKKDFIDTLGLGVLPKTCGIAASIALVGILFTELKLQGASDQLLVGGMSLFGSILGSVLCIIVRSESSAHLVKWLYRIVPLGLLCAYYLTNPVN